MALVQPKIIGPLSELSSAIHVTGQLLGSTVTVFNLDKKLLASGIATSGDQYFDLISGEVLSSKDKLVAVQEFGGEVSDFEENMAMGIQPGPKNSGELGLLIINTPLFKCGRFISVSGLIPGISVEVFQNGSNIGTGVAQENEAVIKLDSELTLFNVSIRQVANLSTGLIRGPFKTEKVEIYPTLGKHRLPFPKINEPIRECDLSILATQIINGTIVTIHKMNSNSDLIYECASNQYWLNLDKELEEGDEITIKQDLDNQCELFGDWSDPIKVGPIGIVDPPIILEPVCKGQSIIKLINLRPGSNISIIANDEVYHGTNPNNSTETEFKIPPVISPNIEAKQELCGIFSENSKKIIVNEHNEEIQGVNLISPLYTCASTVSVKNIHPGSILQVFRKDTEGNEYPISGQEYINSIQASISVAPLLKKGWEVFIVQWACNGKRTDSNVERVINSVSLLPPIILNNVIEGDTQIQVRGVLNGAKADIYIVRHGFSMFWAGSKIGDGLYNFIYISPIFPILSGDTILVSQTMCNEISGINDGVVVKSKLSYGPRPFYIIGHNTNSIEMVTDVLNAGANAIEPDININDSKELCISHGKGDSDAPLLSNFLDDLHNVAFENPNLSLVIFDCKSDSANPDNGLKLLTEIRNRLTYDTGINIIISVAEFKDVSIFDKIKYIIGPREGLMIDYENDPIAVSNHFQSIGVSNYAFGNGVTGLEIDLPIFGKTGPNVKKSLEQSCSFKAATNLNKFNYAWTINGLNTGGSELIQEFIHIGIDGLIVDGEDRVTGLSYSLLPNIINLKNIVLANSSIIRIAHRIDDHMRPENYAYGLTIQTKDKRYAGTDTNITFKLNGTLGAASYIFNSNLDSRMERNHLDYITIQSDDLGTLNSISISHDNQGLGPKWYLDYIIVESYKYGVRKTAKFDKWIDDSGVFTENLI